MLETASQPFSYVLYRSRCMSNRFELTDINILRSALRNNSANNITGFLHREAGFYLQYFEGPHTAVEKLHQLLTEDPRHCDFRLLDGDETRDRCFPGWSMGYSHESKSEFGFSKQSTDPADIDSSRLIDFLSSVSARQAVKLREIGVPTEEHTRACVS